MIPVKNHIISALAVAVLLPCITSCGAPSSDAVSSSHGTATATVPPAFEPRDFEEEKITFLTYNEHATDYTDSYICAEDDDGNAISKAVIERNDATEEMYNVKITGDAVHSPKYEAVTRMQAGQCDFDVMYEWGSRTSSLATDGMLYDFYDLEDIDLTRSYWVPSANEDLTVGGKMYISTNYISMNSIGWANFIYFNKTMYEELGFSETLYDLVSENNWVFDKYVELMMSVSADVDGDGEMTSKDRYGMWGESDRCLVSLTRYAGITNTEKTEDGYDLGLYNETAVSIYTKFKDVLNSEDAFIYYEDIWREKPNLSEFASRHKGARYLGFGEGHVLFMEGTMDMTHEFADMEDDYGVLPHPLYDSNQTEYYHYVDVNAPMFSIPLQADSTDILGTVLEYMACKSEEYLLPAFYDATIKSKRLPDERDYAMLDIVKNSIKYEWTDLYGLSVTGSIMDKMMASGSFKSVYSRYSNKAKAEIKSCVNALEPTNS